MAGAVPGGLRRHSTPGKKQSSGLLLSEFTFLPFHQPVCSSGVFYPVNMITQNHRVCREIPAKFRPRRKYNSHCHQLSSQSIYITRRVIVLTVFEGFGHGVGTPVRAGPAVTIDPADMHEPTAGQRSPVSIGWTDRAAISAPWSGLRRAVCHPRTGPWKASAETDYAGLNPGGIRTGS